MRGGILTVKLLQDLHIIFIAASYKDIKNSIQYIQYNVVDE